VFKCGGCWLLLSTPAIAVSVTVVIINTAVSCVLSNRGQACYGVIMDRHSARLHNIDDVTATRAGTKCTLAACCPLVSHGEYADGTDTQTDGRRS